MIIGHQIKEQRIERGYSLRKFAMMAMISPTYLSRIEKGDFVPGEDLCRRIASLLGFNADLLVIKAGHVPTWIKDKIRTYPKQLVELISNYKG